MIRRSVSSCDSPGPREPMPPLGAREVCPEARQARQLVLELGELHLEAAFVGARVLGEDVEDQPAAVEDLDAEQALEGLLLAGDSSSSATSIVKPVSVLAASSSSALPLPTYQFGSM